MAEKDYSVLMSVYYREKPEYLREAMRSIYDQTVPTDDFVLVCDGPLTPELDAVIEEMADLFGDRLNVVRLEKNGGLGNALNIGLEYCRNDLVARMDSDDISYPDRCERQLKEFCSDPELCVCSGIVEEFSETPDITDNRRVPPETNDEIVAFSKNRNPFNHPCVMYRKAAVIGAGSYMDFYLLEDYYLWIRMIIRGCKGYNIRQPLLHMRAGAAMYRRRSGMKYAKSQAALFRFMYRSGHISFTHMAAMSAIRTASALSPNGLRSFMFRTFLRK